MALSKAELRTLALPGVRLEIAALREKISTLLEEFPELQTQHPSGESADDGPAPSAPRDRNKPLIANQAMEVLANATEPMKAGDVFRAMQAATVPATTNDTSVYTSLAMLASKGLLKRSDDGYAISAKGRKHLDAMRGEAANGGHA